MLPQEEMIERLRRTCQKDARLVAGMLYGSFTRSERDAFSDIEGVLFFEDEALAEIDPTAWIGQIAPVRLYFVNEFGVGTAIFETPLPNESLIRGECHFCPASTMADVESWQGKVWFPSVESVVLSTARASWPSACAPSLEPPRSATRRRTLRGSSTTISTGCCLAPT